MKLRSFVFCIITFSCFSQEIEFISPNEAMPGETLDVTIFGTDTYFTQATNTTIFFFFSSSSSTATSPNSFVIENDNTIKANLTVPEETAEGEYDYEVSNEFIGSMYQSNSFYIVEEDVSIPKNGANTSFDVTLFPNPTNDMLSIEIKDVISSSPIFAEISSLSGKIIGDYKLKTGVNKISLIELKEGVYFVKIVTDKGNGKIFKIIKK